MSGSLNIFISFAPNANGSDHRSDHMIRLLLNRVKSGRAELPDKTALSLSVRVNPSLPQAPDRLLQSGSGSLRTVAAGVRGTAILDKSSDALVVEPNFGNLLRFSAISGKITYRSPIKVIHSGALPLRKGFAHFSSSFRHMQKDGVFMTPPPGVLDRRPTHRRLSGRGIIHIPSDSATHPRLRAA